MGKTLKFSEFRVSKTGFPSFLCISLKPNFVFKKERKSKKSKTVILKFETCKLEKSLFSAERKYFI
jgi:hypothetical protein